MNTPTVYTELFNLRAENAALKDIVQALILDEMNWRAERLAMCQDVATLVKALDAERERARRLERGEG